MIGAAPGARGAPTFPQSSSPELGREHTVSLPCSLPALDRIWGRNQPWKCHSCSQPSPHCSILFFSHGTADPAAFSKGCLSIPAPAQHRRAQGRLDSCAGNVLTPFPSSPALQPVLGTPVGPSSPAGKAQSQPRAALGQDGSHLPVASCSNISD